MSDFKDIIELELRNSLGLLQSLKDRDQLSLIPEAEWASATAERIAEKFNGEYVPFVSEVEEFNAVMGKPNNYEPIIPQRKEWEFVYNFILEELEEYREACEAGDIVEVLDALCDITYVATGNGTMLHVLKDKIWPAYQEVQASNLSKACKTEEEAKAGGYKQVEIPIITLNEMVAKHVTLPFPDLVKIDAMKLFTSITANVTIQTFFGLR